MSKTTFSWEEGRWGRGHRLPLACLILVGALVARVAEAGAADRGNLFRGGIWRTCYGHDGDGLRRGRKSVHDRTGTAHSDNGEVGRDGRDSGRRSVYGDAGCAGGQGGNGGDGHDGEPSGTGGVGGDGGPSKDEARPAKPVSLRQGALGQSSGRFLSHVGSKTIVVRRNAFAASRSRCSSSC